MNSDSPPASRDITPEEVPLASRLPLHVLADNLRSAFNVGGVFRTVDAAGGEMVHLSGYTARPPHPRVVRAAMGAERLVSWKGWPDARYAIDWMTERGFHIVGLEPTSSAVDYRHYSYTSPLCVVVGNEALGISPVVTRRLHGTVRIPMHGYKGSLNVVVALGIVLFRVAEGWHMGRTGSSDGLRHQEEMAALVARIRAAAHHGVWHWCGSETKTHAQVLLLHTPDLPSFDVWAHADMGGVVVMCRPRMREDEGCRAPSPWEPCAGDLRRPAEVPPSLADTHPRSLAFSVAARLSLAAASGGRARLAFDHLVCDLIHRDDLPLHSADPEITRFLDAQSPGQMRAAASRLIAVLLQARGGPWRRAELLYDPQDAGQDHRVDAFVRKLFQME